MGRRKPSLCRHLSGLFLSPHPWDRGFCNCHLCLSFPHEYELIKFACISSPNMAALKDELCSSIHGRGPWVSKGLILGQQTDCEKAGGAGGLFGGYHCPSSEVEQVAGSAGERVNQETSHQQQR